MWGWQPPPFGLDLLTAGATPIADRLRGEGRFKLALASPLLALAVALGITDQWIRLVALPAVGVLAWQGLDKLEKSGDRVADALRGRESVTIPYLEGARGRAPDTDPFAITLGARRCEPCLGHRKYPSPFARAPEAGPSPLGCQLHSVAHLTE